MALTDLPYTIFADVIARLSPREAVAARRVSRAVRAALTRPELCISLLLLHFPRARESRELRTMLQRRDASAQLESVCWAAALAATARRYHHLGTATPRATQTLAPAPAPDSAATLRGVTPWHRFLRLDDKTAAFHYWDPAWTCDADAGLLVHPVAGRRYVLRNVEERGRTWPVPFETEGRLVRRVRLSHGILVFEWCEKEEGEGEQGAHRHFATAYDVKRVRSDGCGDGDDFYTLRRYFKVGLGSEHEMRKNECTITFRAEWKIHSLGILLRHEDRFFSTHNSTHYAVYVWQPPRSPWAGEDEPLERLIVWDIGSSPSGPRIIAQLTNAQLDHWGVCQRGSPSLRGLRLDDRTRDPFDGLPCGHVFFVEEEHRWSAGPHCSPTPPRLHHVKTTGIPLGVAGPRWVDECGKVRSDEESSSSRGSQMPFCRRDSRVSQDAAAAAAEMETWPGRCPCWRHDDFPYLTVCEVHDAGAGVRFSARHCFMLETLSVHVKPRLRVHGVAATPLPAGPTTTTTTTTTTRDASSSSQRAPRRTNSTSQASSMSSQGAKTANGGGVGRAGENTSRRGYGHHEVVGEEEEEGSSVVAGSDASSDSSAAAPTREIQFADDAWAKLLNAGYICGDERWLVGQNSDGAITIMHF
ncbi:hypothetical protein LMH87_005172 [Akanthomyces muscarius]|uniref:F-box domain-containing protein n=1 Tax=Akanthomyces muscarius TaxID=2231603 RepID=A0A9W8QK66_AKAMU|nr:hypothetical protein LMH87_005172 [Akanthomyces muscarius]KAJ4163443.1 hypothetical protein LMH87_005172 [Akanthomyces muscarius]